MRQNRQMDKLRFLTESRNGKKSVIEKLIHKDNFSSNRISCSIAKKSDIKSIMDICFSRQQWMSEQGLDYVLRKDSRKFYRRSIADRKLWVCKQSGEVMGFCVVEEHDINGYWKDFPTDSFVYTYDGMTRPTKSVKETSDHSLVDILLNAIMEFYGKGIRFDMLFPNQRLESFYEKNLGFKPVNKVFDEEDGHWHLLMEKSNINLSLSESFTKKIKSTRKSDLISEPSFVLDDGVYILHETLGVKDIEGWNPKFNEGVVGILLIEDDHKIVVALEDSPKNLHWSEKYKLVNQPIKNRKDAKSDFNGEEYCRNLNSPDFPAAYYCLNYNKGGRDWYLPSSGELWLIYRHLEEIQTTLSIVGGKKFVTTRYCTSTEFFDAPYAWYLNFNGGYLYSWSDKVDDISKVRPISKFQPSELKESFTKKISSKKNTDLISEPSFVLEDGVYILHETLGVKTVEGWNTKFNNGVIGILVVEDDHQIVIALEDSPKNLHWSMEEKKINQSIFDKEDAKSDFNGEEYCKNLNSPEFPAAYYCLNYNKGGRDWYLPSSGELWLIRRHIEEIQNALSIVGGQKFVTGWENFIKPDYWSSTEGSDTNAWHLDFSTNTLKYWSYKVDHSNNVRPVSNFRKKNTLKESFTKKISSKKNSDLVPNIEYPDGVFILHETLGVKTVEEWNPKFNNGVVGILLIEDKHKIVIALEDSPKNLIWSKEEKLVNQPIKNRKDAKSDFNGEEYCKNLNSPDFPAAYYCLNYKKGGRSWYLPSTGELWLICRHLEEIQNALSIVEGEKFVDEWAWYCTSTEQSASYAWFVAFSSEYLDYGVNKVIDSDKVRPISKFQPSELKESFTKKIKKTSNKDLVGIADKLATTNYDYNEENFKNKLRKETELYYKSEFYKIYHYPLDYRRNGDIWSANEDGFHNMWLESTYWAERNEEVDFEGYYNVVGGNYAVPADVGIFVFGYGEDCVAYGEYEEYTKTHQLAESFVSKTKKKTIKDLQGKSDDVFNLNNLLREYVKSHCRPGSHVYDFYFSKENIPVFSNKEWEKLQGITVVKEIDEFPLHVVTPHGFTISNNFLPNEMDDVFLFYIKFRRKFHIPVNRLPENLLQELREWILNINESFTRKTKQKSTEDLRQKADEHIGYENFVKEIVLENDTVTRTSSNSLPRCTHALNKLRVRPTTDPTLFPYEINGTVVLDKSFYFKPEKYDISSLLKKNLTRKSMKELYNSDSIIVLDRIYTMEYPGKELLHAEFNILRYDERMDRYTDAMNPQVLYFKFTDLPKELQSDIYSFLRKKFIKK